MACAMACAACEWHANGMRKGACDVRPPQQPLKHQTKAHHGIRNYGMRQGMRYGIHVRILPGYARVTPPRELLSKLIIPGPVGRWR